ncbi:MAG TPA: hypothetical protein VKA32_07575, partial [Gammaproteobacteria bacterium]|nr:hypothetical protein [Gammaproteobacteria bacterium]
MIRSAIRWVARVLVILVLALLVGLGWLVGTTEGARFALRQASELEPALAARVAGGNLLTGVSLAAFHWSMPGVRVSADRLVLRWRPRCLVDATVCVDRLATDGLTVKVDPAQLGGGGGAGDASASSRLSIPVNIQIRDLSARETHVAVSGGADVRLARLKTGASMWHDSLHVATTTLSGLRVTLPETVAAESDTSKASESVSNKPPLKVALPAIHLPLDVELEGVTLTDARLIQDGRAWSLERLHTVAQVSGQSVRLKTLSVAMPGASGTLQGRVRLQGDWPLSLEIDGHLDRLLDAGAQSLHASLDGSLAKLEARLRATGAVQAQAHATARVLSPDIPWSLSLQSRSLGWPLTGHDTVAATDVSLTGSGDVGHYDLDVRAHLAGASVPPGNWHLKGEGDPQGARIESLTGRVLGGSLKASGRVAWAPRLSWDVDLQADALDPSGVVPQLPGKVNGHLAVKGDVPDNGWSLAVDIKGIDGTLRGYPLKLNGGVSHDAGGAWRFRDVVLRTGDNRVRIDGGLSDTWNLDADLALNRLAALWPGLGGHVKGSVKVSGATTTPSVAGTLTGSSIVWQDLRAGRVTLKANVRKLLRGDSTVDLAAIDLRQG